MFKIIINSSSKKSLNLYCYFLNFLFKKLNTKKSFFNFPTTKKRITLLKSPHVYKKSKEQFEIKTYSSIIIVKCKIEIKTLKYLLLNKPKSVILKLKF
jgi:ribosomal protein S10